MNEEHARKMGYLRFGVISPLLSQDDPRSLKARIEEQANKIWTLPNGRLRQFTADTIEDWYYDYRKGGIDALINPPRRDKGTYRVMSEELCTYIDRILREHPALKSSNIIRLMDKNTMRLNGCPSDATIFRYIGTVRPFHIRKTAQERLAFEAPYAGNLYQTDIMYGPHLIVRQPSGRNRKAPTYLLGIIDDYSRLICHAQFFLSQDLPVYLNVLETAIRKRGIPDKIYCDNGKVFLARQVKSLEAQIGCRIVHTRIRDAAAKGKIERFFGTVRAQFLQLAEVEKVTTLDDLNRRFFQWVEEYNHRKHSSLNCSPMKKWLESPRLPRLLPDTPVNDHIFLLETRRRVKKDGTFSLLGKRYEINYVYAGKKISVRYDNRDRTRVHVYLDDNYIGLAVILDPGSNNNLPRNYKGH